MRILAVDDDPLILEIIEYHLRDIGYDDLLFAASANDALEIISNESYPVDCFLIDINMPKMTGIELIPLIRDNSIYQFTPIIMLTALSDKKHMTTAFRAGAWDYIVKPFEDYELESRLHSAELRIAELARNFLKPDLAPEHLEMSVKSQISRFYPSQQKTGSRAIMEDAFENCVMRLRTDGRAKADVFSVNFYNLEESFGAGKAKPRRLYLVELGRQMAALSTLDAALITYRGNGTFMVMSYEKDALCEQLLYNEIGRAVQLADKATKFAPETRPIFSVNGSDCSDFETIEMHHSVPGFSLGSS